MRADPPETVQRFQSKFRPRLRCILWACATTLMAVLFALSLLPIPSISRADTAIQPKDTVEASVRQFLEQRTASLGDQVTIEIRDSAADLGDCSEPQPFLLRPGVPQGRVTVGIHCGNDSSRTRYLQATVSAQVHYLVTSQDIQAGETLSGDQLQWQEKDISRLRRGYLDDIQQVAGMVATRRIPSGATLTEQMVRKPWLVERGDQVTLTAVGQGFRISRSVVALENGGLGSMIRLKTENNQILQGRVTGQDRLRVDL